MRGVQRAALRGQALARRAGDRQRLADVGPAEDPRESGGHAGAPGLDQPRRCGRRPRRRQRRLDQPRREDVEGRHRQARAGLAERGGPGREVGQPLVQAEVDVLLGHLGREVPDDVQRLEVAPGLAGQGQQVGTCTLGDPGHRWTAPGRDGRMRAGGRRDTSRRHVMRSTMQEFPLTIGAILRHGTEVNGDGEVITATGDSLALRRRTPTSAVAPRGSPTPCAGSGSPATSGSAPSSGTTPSTSRPTSPCRRWARCCTR